MISIIISGLVSLGVYALGATFLAKVLSPVSVLRSITSTWSFWVLLILVLVYLLLSSYMYASFSGKGKFVPLFRFTSPRVAIGKMRSRYMFTLSMFLVILCLSSYILIGVTRRYYVQDARQMISAVEKNELTIHDLVQNKGFDHARDASALSRLIKLKAYKVLSRVLDEHPEYLAIPYNGEYPLHTAIISNDVEAVKAIVESREKIINLYDKSIVFQGYVSRQLVLGMYSLFGVNLGKSAITLALEGRNPKIVRIIYGLHKDRKGTGLSPCHLQQVREIVGEW